MDKDLSSKADFFGRSEATETLKGALDICYSKPGKFIGAAALVSAVGFCSSLLIAIREQTGSSGSYGAFFIPQLALVLLSFVMSTYYMGAMPILTAYSMESIDLNWSGALSWIHRRKLFWSIVFVSIIVGLVVIVGLFLLIIPGVILGVHYMLALPALVLSGNKGVKAMYASKEITKPIFRWALLIAALLYGPVLIFEIGTEILTAVIWGSSSTSLVAVFISGSVGFIFSTFWLPVAYVGLSLLYIRRVGGTSMCRPDLFVSPDDLQVDPKEDR